MKNAITDGCFFLFTDFSCFEQGANVTPVRMHRKANGGEAYIEFYSASDARQVAVLKLPFLL